MFINFYVLPVKVQSQRFPFALRSDRNQKDNQIGKRLLKNTEFPCLKKNFFLQQILISYKPNSNLHYLEDTAPMRAYF